MDTTKRPYDVAYTKITNDLNLNLTIKDEIKLRGTLKWLHGKGSCEMAILLEKNKGIV